MTIAEDDWQYMADEIARLRAQVTEALSQRDRALEQCREARKDAERYRWIRDHDMVLAYDHYHTANEKYGAGVDPLDKTIDEAMREDRIACNSSATEDV